MAIKPETKEAAAQLVDSGMTIIEAARRFGINRDTLSAYLKNRQNYIDHALDKDIVAENVKLASKLQKSQDLNRIKNKSFRESARINNALEEYVKSLIDVFSNSKLTPTLAKLPKQSLTAPVGIIHITDVHFNELVELEHNKYDFEVAGKRLHKLVSKAIQHFCIAGVSRVVIAFTGDLMNSDRRLDELLAMATNRAQATFCAVDILQQLILHVRQYFSVVVAGVNGNEGRVKQDIGFVDLAASDNYDQQIITTLKYVLKDVEGITFVNNNNANEIVLNINGHNVLLAHGHTFGMDLSKAMAKIRSKYVPRGVNIRYVLFGHIHEAYVSDYFARGGSPVGDNAYSDRALHLAGRASQNYHIIDSSGNIDSVKVDLQNYEGIEGYKTRPELHSYNTKSADKCRNEQTIFKVVI